MQSKISLSVALFSVGAAGIVCASIITFFPTLALPVQDPYAKPMLRTDSSSTGLPVRLKIPSINVDAALESVGLTEEGNMDVPYDLRNAAWFNRGPRPGEKGSAVIDGHFGSKNGIPAVFRNLYLLEKGDKIYVEDERGAITTFVVRGFRTYDPEEDALDVFSSSDQQAHLNLITCEGVWDATEKTFSNRLVVFTDKEADETI